MRSCFSIHLLPSSIYVPSPAPAFPGVITALAAFAVNVSVENISGFKHWATLTIMEGGDVMGSYLAYVAMNAALVTASVAITLYIGPAAAGSGIPDVKVGRDRVVLGAAMTPDLLSPSARTRRGAICTWN